MAHGVGRFCRKFYDLQNPSVPETDTDPRLNRPPYLSLSLPPFLSSSPPSFLLPSVTSGRAWEREKEGETVTPVLTAIFTADVTTDEQDPGERERDEKTPCASQPCMPEGESGSAMSLLSDSKQKKQTSTSTFRSRPVAWKQRSATWLIAACTSLKVSLLRVCRVFTGWRF